MLRNSVTRPRMVASLQGQLCEELSRQGACQNQGLNRGSLARGFRIGDEVDALVINVHGIQYARQKNPSRACQEKNLIEIFYVEINIFLLRSII